jgi:uncharacterized protein
MLEPGEAKKVIIHLNADTTSTHDFLYGEILSFLLKNGVSGATVFRPQAGFGSHHRLHVAGAGGVEGEHLPARVEFLERPEVVTRLLPQLCELVTDGLIEMHATTVVKSVARVQPA